MQYFDSIGHFFKSPKWGMNLLFGGICMLIPIVGPIVYMGYLARVFVHMHRYPNLQYPDFEFDQFGDDLKRGLWPFLASLVAGLLVAPIGMVAMAPLMFGPAMGLEEDAFVVLLPCSFLLYLLVMILWSLVFVPIMIRSALMQDFGAAFNFAFIKDFIKRVSGPIILSQLFIMFFFIVFGAIGYCALFVGLYAVMAVGTFAQWHLMRQLYELYLERGGTPIEISPDLDVAPTGQMSPTCLQCGYDLRGLAEAGSSTCPECGAPINFPPPPAAPPTSPPTAPPPPLPPR